MENYFNYFTEIEERWQQCRGTVTLLSPLDWALIESFQESGIPLEVVLRGMELAFAKQAKRPSKAQKVNSLSYCAQAILSEFERLQESSIGKHEPDESASRQDQNERENLVQMMERTIGQLVQVSERIRREGLSVAEDFFESIARTLQSLKQEVVASIHLDFEQLEMRLSMLEDKILATLFAALNDEVLLDL